MKILQKTLVVITCFLFIFVLIIYYDNNHQNGTITNLDTKQLLEEIPTVKNAYTTTKDEKAHLQSLGFSDYTIANLSEIEAKYYLSIKGKLVHSETYYEELKQNSGKRMKKDDYFRLLTKNLDKTATNKNTLLRTKFSIMETSKKRFFVMSEIHVDYVSKPLKETIFTTNYDYRDTINKQYAKQIWWTASSLEKNEYETKYETYTAPTGVTKADDKELSQFNTVELVDQPYTISWYNAKPFEDVIGLHYFYTATFSVSDELLHGNMTIQMNNPYYSIYLQKFYDY